MTEQSAIAPARAAPSPLRVSYLIAAMLALAVMTAAILGDNLWFLDFIHVMSGGLWTGIDLFMGFVVGPIIGRLPFEMRRAVIAALVPRTLVLMPTLSIMTSTSGWFLAQRMGFLDLGFPQFYWVIAALAIVTVLTIQGMGILLPTNVRVLLEVQKADPDTAKIGRLMRPFFRVVAVQGVMQVAIIVVMARFATGL